MSWLPSDPLLVLGMHRSGTTLLARILDDLGAHLGHHLEENHESIAFLETNDAVMAAAHASWDRPESWPWLLEQETARGAALHLLRDRLRDRRFRWRYAGLRAVAAWSAPDVWGFKDPRSTLTLPLWRELFPQAKVVIVRRHGVDVAASLRHRARQQTRPDSEHLHNPHLLRFVSLRSLSLARGFELWKFYNDFFDQLDDDFPVCDLRYEDLLQSPQSQLRRVCEFAGLTTDEAALAHVSEGIRSDRALAYRSDSELVDFAESVCDDATLRRLGYDPQTQA